MFWMASCKSLCVSSYIKNNFTNCYDEKNTGLDTLININGYYTIMDGKDRYGYNAIYVHKIDTFYTCFMFFPKGLYLGLFSSGEKDLTSFFNEVNKCVEKKGTNCGFYKYYFWGKYQIEADTIITQSINRANSLNEFYNPWERKFQIINKNSLKLIASKPLHKTAPISLSTQIRQQEEEMRFEKIFGRKRIDSDTAFFVPLEEIPLSDYCWLKERRWFWCDKEQYKAWKRENRKRKKILID